MVLEVFESAIKVLLYVATGLVVIDLCNGIIDGFAGTLVIVTVAVALWIIIDVISEKLLNGVYLSLTRFGLCVIYIIGVILSLLFLVG